nr:MAG TPA: hypothetical protein [Caudoviricetes sp.]
MDQETQQQPPVENGQASGAADSKAKVVKIDYHTQQIKMIIDLLATGGYTQSMLYEVRASEQGREGVGELLLSDVEAKETEHGNSELTVVFSGELKKELSKNNTLIDGDKFKHAYYRLDWEEEAKRIRGDLRTPPELEIDGYRVVSLLSLDKVIGPGFTNTSRLSDLFVYDFYPDKLKKIHAGDIDTEESIFKGIGALLRASGKRFVSGNEVNVDLSSFAHSTEKPGIGLFEFTAPFTQLDILKWFYFGITDVERKIFVVFDLSQANKTTSYNRSENRVPQIGRFTFFGTQESQLREDDPNRLKVADLTTAEPLNIPLTSTSSGDIDTFVLNHSLSILTANNITMYNNQYGKPFERLGDHMANQSNAFSDIGFQYDDVGEGVEGSPELIEAVANIPGYEDTTNLSSRVVGVRFRNDITLAKAYADKTGIIGNWVIPVEKANLANEFLAELKETSNLKEAVSKKDETIGEKDNDIFAASYTGDVNQDIALIVKSTTAMLEVDDSKHNKITTTVDDSTFLPYVKQIVKSVLGDTVYSSMDVVEDTEYEHEHAKVYEIKPKSAFTNICTGKKVRLVYMKAKNDGTEEETHGGSPEDGERSELKTELSGFARPSGD